MDLPIDPLVGPEKHADSAARQRQESVPEPNDNASASSASLDKYWRAILHALLNLIHTNAIHQPGNDSLQFVNHRSVRSFWVKRLDEQCMTISRWTCF
jgi:hypothetical protein